MLVYDGIFNWKGWGGKLGLGKGRCHLTIFDRSQSGEAGIVHLKPVVAIVKELPNNSVSVRAVTGHIATSVVKEFNLDPQRLLWIEYYPESIYGPEGEYSIPERFDAIEFTWEGRKALSPRCKTLTPPILDAIKGINAGE